MHYEEFHRHSLVLDYLLLNALLNETRSMKVQP